mgnify:CR=1 FL=1
MAIQKTIDKTSNKISTMYTNGLAEIVDQLLEIKKGITNKDFATTLLRLMLRY